MPLFVLASRPGHPNSTVPRHMARRSPRTSRGRAMAGEERRYPFSVKPRMNDTTRNLRSCITPGCVGSCAFDSSATDEFSVVVWRQRHPPGLPVGFCLLDRFLSRGHQVPHMNPVRCSRPPSSIQPRRPSSAWTTGSQPPANHEHTPGRMPHARHARRYLTPHSSALT